MPPTTSAWFVMGTALLAAAVAGLLLLPLAQAITRRLYSQWVDDAKATLTGPPTPQPALTGGERLLVCFVSAALCGLLALVERDPIALAAHCLLALSLVLLVAINVKELLLPDVIVYPLMWLGLLVAARLGKADGAVLGAAIAYAVPYAITALVRRHGRGTPIGDGDLKAFAMAGAWVGVAGLSTYFIVYVAAIVVSGFVLTRLERKIIPTGPAHAMALLSAYAWSRYA